MPLRDQATEPVRAHWRRAILPAGLLLSTWGNALYDSPHRTASLIMFISGLPLIHYGRRPWHRFVDNSRAWKRVQRWVAQKRVEPKWKHRWERLKVTTWGLFMLGVVLYAWKLLGKIAQEPGRVNEHVGSGMVLMAVWALLPLLAQSAEPKDPPKEQLLEQISDRTWRAVITRTVANTAGIYFAGLLIYMLVFSSRPSLIMPAAVTLGGAAVATGHKTWTRSRKLSTQLYRNIQTLERNLAMIPAGRERAADEKRDAARKSWDAVELDLRTSVDTGYALFGTPFLPTEMTTDLRLRVEAAIEAVEGNPAATKEVLDDLGKVREACTGRLDSVA
ncbi:hypothetical protein [Streptomyces tubercidicus]|uniref:hypothetical protein n=1 Tax=Streptomyces tubercidicus TaxID=47759 RepID=UPI00346645BE